jgi:hypothetical protein
LLGAGSIDFVLGDGFSGDDGAYGGPYQQYGISSADAANTLSIGNIRYTGNVTGTTTGLTAANVRLHPNVSTNRYQHPGFTAEGGIAMAGFEVSNFGWLSGGADGTATFSTGVLTCSRTNVQLFDRYEQHCNRHRADQRPGIRLDHTAQRHGGKHADADAQHQQDQMPERGKCGHRRL